MIHKLTTSNHCKSKTRAFIALLKIITLSEEKNKRLSDAGLFFMSYQKKTVTIQMRVTFKGKIINVYAVDRILNELAEHRNAIH